MFCNNCGASIPDNTPFCPSCGARTSAPVQQPGYPVSQPAYPTPVQQPGKGFAIASMVLGIVSFFCFAFITGLLGIVFGGVAKSKGSRSSMATAGIVCGVIGVALWLLMLLFFESASMLFYEEFLESFF